MNRDQHLLICLMEECDEVGQRVSKALRFGLSEVQPGQNLTNAERIVEELGDLLSVAAILRAKGLIPQFYTTPTQVMEKQAKIEKFMAISIREGTLQP